LDTRFNHLAPHSYQPARGYRRIRFEDYPKPLFMLQSVLQMAANEPSCAMQENIRVAENRKRVDTIMHRFRMGIQKRIE
jgi:hypothetical protein